MHRVEIAFTDQGIVLRAMSSRYAHFAGTVRDAMKREVPYCYDDQDVEEAARLMKEYNVGRLIVLNRAQQLVGVISLGDLHNGENLLAGEPAAQVSESPEFAA